MRVNSEQLRKRVSDGSRTETILSKTLDEVDRIRKRQTVAFLVPFFLLVGLFIWLGRLSESHTTDLRQLLLASVFVLEWAMAYVAMAIAIVIIRMTLKF